VVLDELCSGTNPSEGEEIFQLVLQLLSELDVQVWLSTHFLRFAAELQQNPTPKLQFLRVQLDSAEQPLFCFEPGVAFTSLAKQTAARLGVTLEDLTRLVHLSQERGPRFDEPDVT
jgi:DNA mismatch repair protein MutS2